MLRNYYYGNMKLQTDVLARMEPHIARTVRAQMRRLAIPHSEQPDVLQEARLAVLLAHRAGLIPGCEPNRSDAVWAATKSACIAYSESAKNHSLGAASGSWRRARALAGTKAQNPNLHADDLLRTHNEKVSRHRVDPRKQGALVSAADLAQPPRAIPYPVESIDVRCLRGGITPDFVDEAAARVDAVAAVQRLRRHATSRQQETMDALATALGEGDPPTAHQLGLVLGGLSESTGHRRIAEVREMAARHLAPTAA